MTADWVTIRSDALSARIATLGAELQALRDPDGRDLQWDGDPQFWTGRAPILFPIVGRLRGDRYRLGDATFEMGKHGFARKRTFDLLGHDDASARFRLTADAETRAQYPFDFVLEVEHRLAGATLTIAADVFNPGDEPMPFSLGFHPALRWPLPFGQPRAGHHLLFAEPEPAPIRRLGRAEGIDPAPHPSPVEGRTLMLRDALFTNDAIIMDQPASRSVRYAGSAGPALEVAWEGLPYLGVWTVPGAPFICIEPWHGMADPEGFDGDFRAKPGMIELAPGERRRFAVHITLLP